LTVTEWLAYKPWQLVFSTRNHIPPYKDIYIHYPKYQVIYFCWQDSDS